MPTLDQPATPPHPTLVLVVGASGVGKDSLINAARRHFAGNSRLIFPVRHITRARDAGGEEHIAVSTVEFAANRARGAYGLAWEAHGLCYGIPVTALAALEEGKSVIVNVSRRILPEAEALGLPMAVINITATPETLARRLAARGRESAGDIVQRLTREAPIHLRRAPLLEVANDSDLAAGENAFIAAVSRFIPEAHGGNE